jgi:hypothetical protein
LTELTKLSKLTEFGEEGKYREMEFRVEQVLRTAVEFPSATWEQGDQIVRGASTPLRFAQDDGILNSRLRDLLN